MRENASLQEGTHPETDAGKPDHLQELTKKLFGLTKRLEELQKEIKIVEKSFS